MSRQIFDPNSIRLEDIFRAKRERRQRLAKLPIEEKIKIVERLQTVSAALVNEKLVFKTFLSICPNFAGEAIREWDPVDDWYATRSIPSPAHPWDKRPDIIALTVSGRRIGIELKSWVNQAQITAARKQEKLQDNILKAIGDLPLNTTKHIGCVWLSPNEIRFDAREAAVFREQLFLLIEKVDEDNRWSKEPTSPMSLLGNRGDFASFPVLEKYLKATRFHPVKRRPTKRKWILFPSPARHYSPNEMRETLHRALVAHRSDARYKDLRAQVGLDEVYLLVHYDFKAFAYNTAFAAPGFGFKEAADLASGVLSGNGGYFDRIFLFHFLWRDEEARRIL
jgi:hypothetical protein